MSRCPPKEKLQALYWGQRLSTHAIADIYGVTHASVGRWLRNHDIPRRVSGCGLINRGITPPTSEDLKRLVHVEHLNYRAIAAKFGVDPSAITHWLDRHGIERPSVWDTRRKGEHPQIPTRAELRSLYLDKNRSQYAIAQHYGISASTVGRLMRKYAIPVRTEGWRGGIRWICKDGHSVRSTYEQRIDNWLYKHSIPHEYEPPLPFDRRRKADFLANGWYIEMWGVTDSTLYNQRKTAKLALYKTHDTPLIEIPAHAFEKSRNRMWERRLQKCLRPPLHHISDEFEELTLPYREADVAVEDAR